MFVRETVERFYDGYGLREWERLEQDAYHRLIFTLHADFLRPGIAPGRRVLDAGCGGGRFSLLCAAQLKMPLCDFWGKPEVWGIYQVLETGDEPAYPGASQPPRHYFTSAELHGLLTRNELTQLTLAAAPAILTGLRDQAETLARDPKAWKVIEDMERSQYQNPAITDCGEFLLARARVQKGERHYE